MSARVLPAVLGWANPTRDRENLRLYALDAGPSPRWAEKPIGRVAEQALRERGGHEGDRLLVVDLDGGRWLTEADLDRLAGQVTAALTDDGPAARLTAVSAAHAWGCDCTDDDPCRIAIALGEGEAHPDGPDRVDVNRTALRLLLEAAGVNPASTDYGLRAQVAAVADRQLPGWRAFVPRPEADVPGDHPSAGQVARPNAGPCPVPGCGKVVALPLLEGHLYLHELRDAPREEA